MIQKANIEFSKKVFISIYISPLKLEQLHWVYSDKDIKAL